LLSADRVAGQLCVGVLLLLLLLEKAAAAASPLLALPPANNFKKNASKCRIF
jgi:hypothetical protein